jgi:hypothetical protein
MNDEMNRRRKDCLQVSALNFQVSAFSFLPSGFSLLPSGLVHSLRLGVFAHRDEDGDQFIGFRPDWLSAMRRDTAVFLKQFEPELRFIGFLRALLDLGDKLGIGAGSRSFAVICRN